MRVCDAPWWPGLKWYQKLLVVLVQAVVQAIALGGGMFIGMKIAFWQHGIPFP